MKPEQTSEASQLELIQRSLNSVGYNHTNLSYDNNTFIVDAFTWCISSFSPLFHIDTVGDIEEALKMVGCPYPLEASQVENLEYDAIFPALQWLVTHVKTAQHDNYNANDKKISISNELQFLKERATEAGIGDTVQKLASLLQTSKALERQTYDFQSEYKKEHSKLLADIIDLEEKSSNGSDDVHIYDCIDNLCHDLSNKLKSAKRELASELRRSVSLKRQLDDMPIQEEVVQYEQRFTELNIHIQDRLQRTRNYYSTYNALVEIKDLMLKEISLLNSLDSQFQNAIEDPAGHIKLIHSMEAILKGTRLKLEKVQPGLDAENKALDRVREKYITSIRNQRSCSALLKGFQEECEKNKRLKDEVMTRLKSEGPKG